VIAKRLREQEQQVERQRVVFESRKVWDAGEAMRDLRAISELEGEVRALAWALALSRPQSQGLVGVRPPKRQWCWSRCQDWDVGSWRSRQILSRGSATGAGARC
jgi:hypothetical protein